MGDALEPLRGPFHDLQPGLVDGPKRNVARPRGERSRQLRIAMGADAEARTLRLDRRHVRIGEILLTKVDVVCAERQRLPPVVVDDELATVAGADLKALADLAADPVGQGVLEAELDRLDPQGNNALEPSDVGNDGVENVE